MDIAELAAQVGLHRNTVREHLDRMVDVRVVERSTFATGARGRPGMRYRALPEPEPEDAGGRGYARLARALVDQISDMPDALAVAVDAGARWGRAMAGGGPAVDSLDPVERLIEVLDDAGFAPQMSAGPGSSIGLRRCPFGVLARERSDVVCGVHLGLMRGVLAELGAPLDGLRLEPFMAPDLCVAHLATVGWGTRDVPGTADV